MKEIISKNINKLVQNVFSLFVVRTADLLITVLLIPFIIQKIGVLFYGNYVYVYAYAMFFVNLLAYGFDISAVRDISKSNNPNELSRIFNEVVSAKLLLFIGVTIFYFGLGFLVFNNNEQLLKLLNYSFFLVVAEFLSFRWFYYGVIQNWILALVSIISTSIFCYLVFFRLNDGADNFYLLPFYQSISFVILGIGVFFFTINRYKIKFRLLKIRECFTYLKLNFTSFINLLIPSILANTVVFFAGALSLPQNASIAQLAIKFTNVFSTANTILTQVLFPFVNKTKKAFSASTYLLCFVGVIISMAMYILSDFLIGIWLKGEGELVISKVVTLVKILSPTPLLMALISAYGINGLLVNKKDLIYSKINLVILVVIIIFCVFTIDINYIASALILLYARIVYVLMIWFSYKKKRILLESIKCQNH